MIKLFKRLTVALFAFLFIFCTKEKSQLKMCFGETFCLKNEEPKTFLYKPEKVLSIYRIDDKGQKVFLNKDDYEIVLKKGTIKRKKTAGLNYASHTIRYTSEGKIHYTPVSERPDMNLPYTVFVDYEYYETAKLVKSGIKAEKLIAKLKKAAPVRIFQMGTSITNGAQTVSEIYSKSNYDGFGKILERSLQGIYKSEIVVNKWNYNVPYVAIKDFPNILKTQPDCLMIEFGMNEHNIGGVSETVFKQQIVDIVRAAKSNNIEVVLVGFFRRNPLFILEDVSRTISFNEALRQISVEENVPFADIEKLFIEVAKKKNLFEDVIEQCVHHPNNFGHQLYAEEILPIFR